MQTVLARHPPNDDQTWDCQCGRCGSSLSIETCPGCDGDGFVDHDCGEDTCCCAEPIDNVACSDCDGSGGFPECISSPEWCNAHPMRGREQVNRATPEWFAVEENAHL